MLEHWVVAICQTSEHGIHSVPAVDAETIGILSEEQNRWSQDNFRYIAAHIELGVGTVCPLWNEQFRLWELICLLKYRPEEPQMNVTCPLNIIIH